ncbi:MAG: HAD-IA family hydrolase, partial [Desulfobacterales bacterium]
FDFDGTLTKPGIIDFALIKKTIGCPLDQPILEFIAGLADSEDRASALSELDRIEFEAAARTEPNPGAEEIVHYLQAQDLPLCVISRNSLRSIKRALENFGKITEADFDLIISRDEPIPHKPDPDGIYFAADKLGHPPEHLLVVGDYLFDIQAGNRAGATTVLIDNATTPSFSVESAYRISHLHELKDIVRLGLPLQAGKLPNDLLEEFLDDLAIGSENDPTILIKPGIGEDTAAVDVSDDEILVLKSDPITFAADAPGQYAVLINANDIATSGATPRWFMTTLLFPSGTTGSEIRMVMKDLQSMCRQSEIVLCGGHTEITDAVTRPVISGMMVGTVRKKNLRDKRHIVAGDQVLLTKAVAVEGTSIIAREFADRLLQLGMEEAEIERCKQFLSRIGILEEAGIAGSFDGVSAMHDVTEGGLATAMDELSIAGNHAIRIDMDRIPTFPETDKICRLLDLDPMGLIGSGSLIICCSKADTKDLMNQLGKASIATACIGEVLEKGRGITATKGHRKVPWPHFEVDEITRLF